MFKKYLRKILIFFITGEDARNMKQEARSKGRGVPSGASPGEEILAPSPQGRIEEFGVRGSV